MSAPPIGGSLELVFDTSTFVAPGQSRATTPVGISVPGGIFAAGRKFVFVAMAEIEVQTDGVGYEVLLELQTSIDALATFQTAGSVVPQWFAPATLGAQRIVVPVLAELAFTTPPVGDVVGLQLLATNDGSSASGIVLASAPGGPGNPRINFQLASAA